MKFLSNQQTGSLYAISSGLSYGLLGYFGISIIKAGSSVPNMLFWRFLISSLLVLIVLLPKYKIVLQSPKDNFKMLLSGMIFYSGSAIVFFMSSVHIGTGLAMVTSSIYPAIIMAINIIFYNAKLNKVYFVAFLIIMLGLIFLVDTKEFTLSILGIGFGVATAMFYACYVVTSERIAIHPTSSTLMVSIGCMITCFIFSLLDSSFNIPVGLNNWINLICIGLICTAIPILLLLRGLRYISAEKAAILSVLEPVFMVVFGVVLLGEKINQIQVIGTVIVLSGALIVLFHKNANREIELTE